MKFDFVRDDSHQGSTDGAVKAVFLSDNLEHMPYATSWGGDFTARNKNGWLTVEDEKVLKPVKRKNNIFIRMYGNMRSYTDQRAMQWWHDDDSEYLYMSPQSTQMLSPWKVEVRNYAPPKKGHRPDPQGAKPRFPGLVLTPEYGGPRVDSLTSMVYTGDGGFLILTAVDGSNEVRRVTIDRSQTQTGGEYDRVLRQFTEGVGNDYIRTLQTYPPGVDDDGDIISLAALGASSPDAQSSAREFYTPPARLSWTVDYTLLNLYPRANMEIKRLSSTSVEMTDERYPSEDRKSGFTDTYDLGYIRFQAKQENGMHWVGSRRLHGLTTDPSVTQERTPQYPLTSKTYHRSRLIAGSATYPFPILIVPVIKTDTMTHKLVARSIDPKTGKVVREVTFFRHNALMAHVLQAQRIGPKTLAVVVVLTSPYFRRGGPPMQDASTDPNIPLDTVVATYTSVDNGITWQRVKEDALFAPHREPPRYPQLPQLRTYDKIRHSVQAFERMVMFTAQISRIEILPLREGKALIVASRSYLTDKLKGRYRGISVMTFDVATGVLDVEKGTISQVEVLYTSPPDRMAQCGSLPWIVYTYTGEDELYVAPWTENNPHPVERQAKVWMDATQRIADVAVSPSGAVIMVGTDASNPANVTLYHYDTEGVRRHAVPIPGEAYLAGSAIGEHDGRFRFVIGGYSAKYGDPEEGVEGAYRLAWTPEGGFQDKNEVVNGVHIDAISRATSKPPEPNKVTGSLFSIRHAPILYYQVLSAHWERCIQFDGKWLPLEPAPSWVYQ